MPEERDDADIADGLEIPADLAAIWRARADEVERSRPLIQGDVFDGVVLPGLEDEPGLTMIVDHPCSMRRGALLRERIQMVRVREERALPRQRWPRGQGHFRRGHEPRRGAGPRGFRLRPLHERTALRRWRVSAGRA